MTLVLVTTILASKVLKEEVNILGKVGCINVILGSTILIIHAPKEEEITSLDYIGAALLQPGFIIYFVLIVATCLMLVKLIVPYYGSTNVVVYIYICSVIGSLSVMACKGLGLALIETINGVSNNLTQGLFWFFLTSVIITVSLQMNYLNKSLDIFDTTIVTPIYYTLFTTFVLIASSILFNEWASMSAQDIVGALCGFLITVNGIFILNAFKAIQFEFLASQYRPITKVCYSEDNPSLKSHHSSHSDEDSSKSGKSQFEHWTMKSLQAQN